MQRYSQSTAPWSSAIAKHGAYEGLVAVASKTHTHREAARLARLEALRAHNMGAYLALVQQERSEVLHRVLARTDECLQCLARRLPASLAAQLGGGGATPQQEAWRVLASSLQADIAEQPAMLRGGQLHGFQMQGLRWMVGLFDAQLNGVLAVGRRPVVQYCVLQLLLTG